MEPAQLDANSRQTILALANDGSGDTFNVRVNPFTGAVVCEADVTSSNTIISSTIPGGTAGSVLFLDIGSTLAEDNNYFYYDPISHELALGHNSPTATLDILGSLKYVDGNEGDTYVLISDASGNASWNDLTQNTTFIDNLVNNNYFTTSIANNSNFVTVLTNNSSFITDITTIITTGGSLTIEDEGTPLSGLATTLNFVGSGVTVTGSGATKTITIPGGGSGAVQSVTDNGNGHVTVNNTDPANPVIDFDGVSVDGVTITGTGLAGSPLVAVSGGQAAIQFENESGTHLGTAGTVNELELTGGGVAGSRTGDKVTYTIPGGSAAIRSYTAAMDITAKDLVGISDGLYSEVSLSSLSSIASASGLTITNSIGLSRINTDKYVFLYSDGTNLKSVICTLNGNYTVSFGTPVTVAVTSAVTASVTSIDTDKFIVVRFTNVSTTYTRQATVATVSGTTITLGTETALSSTFSSDGPYNVIVKSANTDEALMGYTWKDVGSTNQTQSFVGITVSGTTPSNGSTTDSDTHSIVAFQTVWTMEKSDTGQYLRLGWGSDTSQIRVFLTVITQSGTTLTVGTGVKISDQNPSDSVLWITPYAASKPLIAYRTSGGGGAIALVGISGTVPTVGTGGGAVTNLTSAAFTDNTDVWLGSGGTVLRYTVSGTTLTPTSDFSFAVGISGVGVTITDGKIYHISPGTSFSVWFYGVSISYKSFIGVAITTATIGQPVSVQVSGEAQVNTITAIPPGSLGIASGGGVIAADLGDFGAANLGSYAAAAFRVSDTTHIIL